MAKETAGQITARLYAKLGYAPSDITRRLLVEELGLNASAREVLFPWVRDRVQHEISRRGRTPESASQQAERELLQAERERQQQVGLTITRRQRVTPAEPFGDPRLKFLDAHVPCPGAPGGMKTYGQFTVADHQARARVHQVNLNGASRRIAGHSWAVQEIEAHRASVLDDIADGTLVAELPEGGVTP